MPPRLPFRQGSDTPIRPSFGALLVVIPLVVVILLLFVVQPSGPIAVGSLAVVVLALVFLAAGMAVYRQREDYDYYEDDDSW